MNLKNIKFINDELEKEYSTRQTYKIIILIIASSGQVHYDIFKHCWMEYMDKFPEVKCFFLYCDNTIDCDILVTHNSIIYNCEETYIPGILYKITGTGQASAIALKCSFTPLELGLL